MSEIAAKEPLKLEISEVVVDTGEMAEVAEVDKEKDDMAQAGEQAIGAMRIISIGRKWADLTVRGAAAALPS